MVQRALEDHPGVSASPRDRDIFQRISTCYPAITSLSAKDQLVARVRRDGI